MTPLPQVLCSQNLCPLYPGHVPLQLLSLYTDAKEAGEIIEENEGDGWETASDSEDRYRTGKPSLCCTLYLPQHRIPRSLKTKCLGCHVSCPVCFFLSNSNSGWVNVQHDDGTADEPAAKRSKKNPPTEEDEALTEVNNGVVRDTLSKEDRLKRAQALTASKVQPLFFMTALFCL